jgi:hypothetical protein
MEAEGIVGEGADGQLPPLTAFEEAVRETIQTAADGQPIDPEALAGALRSAFADLVDGLKGLQPGEPAPGSFEPSLMAITPDVLTADVAVDAEAALTPVDRGVALDAVATEDTADAISAEAESAETGEAGDPFAALTVAFEEALAQFLDTISEAMRMPEPAPAPGHGAAYAKFLAIYESLRSPGEVDITG